MYLVHHPCPISGAEQDRTLQCSVCGRTGFHPNVFDQRRQRCLDHWVDFDALIDWQSAFTTPEHRLFPADKRAILRTEEILIQHHSEAQSICGEVAFLPQLKTLRIAENGIASFPPAMHQASGLQRLGLNAMALEQVPDFVFSLTGLHALSLAHNELTDIPESLERLTSLESLALGWNHLTRIPESIRHLSTLQSLYLWDNEIETLPYWIAELPSLKRLHIQGNLIRLEQAQIKSLKNRLEDFQYSKERI